METWYLYGVLPGEDARTTKPISIGAADGWDRMLAMREDATKRGYDNVYALTTPLARGEYRRHPD